MPLGFLLVQTANQKPKSNRFINMEALGNRKNGINKSTILSELTLKKLSRYLSK
jgi:hypothetical protein